MGGLSIQIHRGERLYLFVPKKNGELRLCVDFRGLELSHN